MLESGRRRETAECDGPRWNGAPRPGPLVYPSAMEDLDRRLVGLLLADGRMSYTDLGKATGLSTSAVHQRGCWL